MEDQLHLGENDALVRLRRAWEEALKLLSPEINRPSFESFIRTAKVLAANESTAVIGASSELAKIFLEKYAEPVRTALESVIGEDLELEFTLIPKEAPKTKSADFPKEGRPPQSGVSSFSMPLNDKYTFSNFIVGTCNRLANAVAKSVSQEPGSSYNPFFLYGGPGLGKTHLLQAIGHQVSIKHPSLRVAFVSGEMFTSQYVGALREHKSEEFRRRYRSIDVWLVDDVQFLAGKERTKEEFFHTFNALYQMNKQIVLCSDRSPRDLDPLEERLKSRFESGIVADIAPPDHETRLAILMNKAAQEKADVPPEVLECVARLIQTNIRALEGALVTLLAYTSLMKQPLSVPLAEQVLNRYLSEKKYAELNPDIVQLAVAKAFSVEVADLRGGKRSRELVIPRQVAMHLCRELTDCTLPAIGRAFGKNHATVIHSCSRAKELMENDPEVKSRVEKVSEDLRSGRV